MLDTLEYVHRSGRVGWARARIGSLLRIKPFVEVKAGQVFNMGQTRTRKKGIAHLKALFNEQGNLERLAILHTNAETDALAFIQESWAGNSSKSPNHQCNHHHRYTCWPKWSGICGSAQVTGKIHAMKPSIEKLQKFFRLESDRNYDNKAVMGGLQSMLEGWELEARADEVPEELIQAVIIRLRDYHRLTETSRKETLHGIWARVQRETGSQETIEAPVHQARIASQSICSSRSKARK